MPIMLILPFANAWRLGAPSPPRFCCLDLLGDVAHGSKAAHAPCPLLPHSPQPLRHFHGLRRRYTLESCLRTPVVKNQIAVVSFWTWRASFQKALLGLDKRYHTVCMRLSPSWSVEAPSSSSSGGLESIRSMITFTAKRKNKSRAKSAFIPESRRISFTSHKNHIWFIF